MTRRIDATFEHLDYFGGYYNNFINATIIKAGYATPMTVPPNVKYADLFKELYAEAMKESRGLHEEEIRLGPFGSYLDPNRSTCRREKCPGCYGPCCNDAKLCPDGSLVQRVPPTCELAKCPKGE